MWRSSQHQKIVGIRTDLSERIRKVTKTEFSKSRLVFTQRWTHVVRNNECWIYTALIKSIILVNDIAGFGKFAFGTRANWHCRYMLGFSLNYQQHKFDISANYFFPFISFITARKRSCGKVMFLHLFVCPHGGRTIPDPSPRLRPDPLERTWDQTGSDIIPPERKMGPDRKWHHIPSTDI